MQGQRGRGEFGFQGCVLAWGGANSTTAWGCRAAAARLHLGFCRNRFLDRVGLRCAGALG